MKQYLLCFAFIFVSMSCFAFSQDSVEVNQVALCSDYLKLAAQPGIPTPRTDLVEKCKQVASLRAELDSMKEVVLQKINAAALLNVQHYNSQDSGVDIQANAIDQASVVCNKSYSQCTVDIKPELVCKLGYNNLLFTFSSDAKTLEQVIFYQSSGCVGF